MFVKMFETAKTMAQENEKIRDVLGPELVARFEDLRFSKSVRLKF